ncbi:ATP-dependent helicase [Microbacterium marinilacus]|uniref:DNA 3'-5' helicase n=1 Tax=Microbacterium marinilacus TaxID=415209 RepID=A0ABP7B7W4_9MICO|nr:ATP-dependent helicase [Microbacterium marinilacus]MBY0687526.1 ATP-dependent helicase [Microbacterium marinilacus]
MSETGSPLDGLDEHQREAAATLRGPVVVLAGAGAGKTRVITHRIAHGVDTGAYSPQRVMAVTFTAKAAGELRGRLRGLGIEGVSAKTFHAAALSQLNYFWPQVAGDEAPRIVDNKVKLLAHAADAVRLRPDRATLRDVASQIEWRKVTMRTIEQYARLGRTVGALRSDALVALMTEYERLKDERRQLDFEDVLLACAGMLEAEPRVVGAVREQYRHFTVDEFQDVSPLQNRLLELWLGERRDLCVVGDASQTVYSFTGAESRFLLEFGSRYPDAKVVRLERNYRSDPAVLDVANALMRGRPGALTLVAARSDGGAPAPVATAYDDDRDEADGVADSVARQLASATADEVAILYRSHAQSALIQQSLAARGIPTTVLGGTRFFDMPEVRQAVLAIRAAAVAPHGSVFLDDVRSALRGLGHQDEPPAAGGALRDAWEARAALLRLAEAAPEGTTLRGFADDLMARAKDQHEPAMRTVTLSTLHAAKGLEWPHVHILGFSEGLLPISYASSLDGVDEERRLAYVGITRAARSLSISWARMSDAQRPGRGERAPSRFLAEIGPSLRHSQPRRHGTGTRGAGGASATPAGRQSGSAPRPSRPSRAG